ncbi:MAG: hybrid sensor histidine kinase/response regulator [Polyangiales bacterium]
MPSELDEVEFLSNATVALTELSREEDILRFVAESLARLAPESMVSTVSYDPQTGLSTVRAVAGSEDMQRLARQIAPEPIGQTFAVDLRARQTLAEGKLLPVPGGMHQLTFGSWSVEFSRHFENTLGIRAIFGQPFSREGDFLGAVSIMSRSPSLEHTAVIEAFVRLAAVVIQRRRAEARLRESERRFRMLAENSQDVIFRLRLVPTVAFEYVSPATTQLIGHTPEQLYADARLGVDCLYPAAWLDAGELRELESEPRVARCRCHDDRYMWAEQKFTPIRDAAGRIVTVEGIARDITKRKEAEDALLEVDRRKTEFLAVLSHELRNPLGAIGNGIHVLGRAAPGSEQAKRAREVIERQIAQLTRLIDDLLDVTRITRGKIRLQRERVELTALARATVEDHRSIFAKSNIDLEMCFEPGDVFIHADRTRVRQILDNLLQNASRFTPAGGRTSVSVGTDPAAERAVLRVHNTGASIPREIRTHLFEPFVQADRTLDRSKGGLGLGLALVKGLVELHEGSVEVQSDDAHGTVFTIRLPLDTTMPRAARPSTPKPRRGHARVLLMEDNADAATSLRDALELDDLSIAIASTGPEGIEKARAFHPDVVVCDIGLPEMDGYEVARAIRADPELRALGLVALTGYATPEDVARSRDAGFDRHIAKPPDIDVLERVIVELAEQRR